MHRFIISWNRERQKQNHFFCFCRPQNMNAFVICCRTINFASQTHNSSKSHNCERWSFGVIVCVAFFRGNIQMRLRWKLYCENAVRCECVMSIGNVKTEEKEAEKKLEIGNNSKHIFAVKDRVRHQREIFRQVSYTHRILFFCVFVSLQRSFSLARLRAAFNARPSQ